MALDTEAAPVVAQFFTRPKLLKEQSRLQDRPVYEDRVYVRVLFPTDRLSAPVFPADAQADVLPDGTPITYKDKYRDEYRAFLENAEFLGGTPLASLNLTPARIAELGALNIRTVEQLASVPDTGVRKLGPNGLALIEEAKALLDRARNGRDVADVVAENAALKAELELLRAEQVLDEYEGVSDADLKQMLKDRTGEPVLGNPSRKTLIRALKEAA